MSATTVLFDCSGFSFMSIGQKLIYQTNWDLFNNVQTYNSNVSTVIAAGYVGSNYYQFNNFADKNNYKQGQYLHQQRYPNSNWVSIDPRYQ
jgi:hypothetical protein